MFEFLFLIMGQKTMHPNNIYTIFLVKLVFISLLVRLVSSCSTCPCFPPWCYEQCLFIPCCWICQLKETALPSVTMVNRVGISFLKRHVDSEALNHKFCLSHWLSIYLANLWWHHHLLLMLHVSEGNCPMRVEATLQQHHSALLFC